MNNSEGAQIDGSGNGVTRFAGGNPAMPPMVPEMKKGVAFNFATRSGSPVFVDLEAIQAVQEITFHDAGGKRGTMLTLSSGKEIETISALGDVLSALGWI